MNTTWACPVTDCDQQLELTPKPEWPGRVQAICHCQRHYGVVLIETDAPAQEAEAEPPASNPEPKRKPTRRSS